jgi:hypothetical protein
VSTRMVLAKFVAMREWAASVQEAVAVPYRLYRETRARLYFQHSADSLKKMLKSSVNAHVGSQIGDYLDNFSPDSWLKSWRRLGASAAVFTLASLIFAPIALTQSDTRPPQLVSFSISPTNVDVSNGPAILSVRIAASDDLSGFGSGSTGNGSIDIRHASGASPFGRGSLPITGGTNLNPIFEFTLTVPQFSQSGSYPINLTLIDNVFNTARFTPADLQSLGFPSTITVVSLADTTPPRLVSFSISPTTVDVSNGPATLNVCIAAIDDLSGFGSGSTGNGSIDIRHSSGASPFGRGSLPITGGTNLNPIFGFSLTVPQFSQLGSYPINLTLIDNVFNTARFTPADVQSRGFPSAITVVSNPDMKPPPLGLAINRNKLNFGFSGMMTTSPQSVAVSFTGGACGAWNASSNQSTISVTPAMGTGSGTFQVAITGGLSGIVTVTSPSALNSPQQIQVSAVSASPGVPYGSFDTPLDNTSGISGAIPVTGWALDNLEVSKVDIWREPVGNEPSNALVYIGDAVFVNDARLDVAGIYPNAPFNYRAGWGYLMLTNFLPSATGSDPSGNGTYKLHAIAHNKAGVTVDLGIKTITVDNAHASKPFGTIDTPGQGGTASGNAYINFGWALTQNPKQIAIDGSTISVVIDGQVVGHPTYNQLRSDIATLFPGYTNSGGAVGFYYVDTTKLTIGVHTISWNVFDNAGRGDGIGSRYFNVFNSSSSSIVAPEEPIALSNTLLTKDGDHQLEIEELGQVEIPLGATSGYQIINGERLALPIGSSLRRGVFYWQPGPGFLGEYNLVFERNDGGQAHVHVTIRPKTFIQ